MLVAVCYCVCVRVRMEIYVALRSQILVCIGRVYNVVRALYAHTSVTRIARDLVGNRISSDCVYTYIYIIYAARMV